MRRKGGGRKRDDQVKMTTLTMLFLNEPQIRLFVYLPISLSAAFPVSPEMIQHQETISFS